MLLSVLDTANESIDDVLAETFYFSLAYLGGFPSEGVGLRMLTG